MDNNNSEPKQDGLRQLAKSRVMGKLFGREKKLSTNDDVSDFLQGPSDKLYMTGVPAPTLSRIDTSKASRWPTAAEINHTMNSSRGRSISPKRSRKGLIVRFTDRQPEIIGEGGDEADVPTMEIAQARKRSYSHPPMPQQVSQVQPIPQWANKELQGTNSRNSYPEELVGDFKPLPLRRTQTGVPEIQLPRDASTDADRICGESFRPTNFLRSEPSNPNSYAARVQAHMRAAEGKALLQGTPTAPIDSSSHTQRPANLSTSLPTGTGSSLPIQVSPLLTPQRDLGDEMNSMRDRISPIAKSPTYSLKDTVVAVGVQAVNEFCTRVKHLYKLFELSAESLMHLSKYTVDDLARCATWWFLTGRINLESAARIRPSSPEGQRSNEQLLQQGHIHLAKALWIVEDLVIRRPELSLNHIDDLPHFIDARRSTCNENFIDALERCHGIYTNLQKLTISMKRNQLFPPPAEEAILPQGLDTSIWIKYPSYTVDIPMLLSGKAQGPLGSQATSPSIKLSNALPLGDTEQVFFYNRMYVDLYLMQERVESHQFRCPCVMSIIRARSQKNLNLMFASQSELVTLSIQSDDTAGPTWNDVKWRTANSIVEIKLSRGFVAVVQFSPSDFKNLWNIYDYTMKIHGSVLPRSNEEIIYEKTLESVQYFDRNSQSRVFPKDPVPNCRVKILAKKLSEMAGTGARHKYRGFRIAVITHEKTKQLSGISHELLTSKPIQHGFMRGDSGTPALLLKFEDSSQKSTLVLNFNDVEDRTSLLNSITGGVCENETEMVYLPVKEVSISCIGVDTAPSSSSSSKTSFSTNALDSFEWQHIRVINRTESNNSDPERASTILSENLRILIESRNVNVTDRINLAPGELQIRLATQHSTHGMTILRKSQEDMTISLSESQVQKEVPGQLTELLKTISNSQSLRRYQFSNVTDLHAFQAAVTGFRVVFDGQAESFAISRRRMVVPIYKKWEASGARVQILRREKVLQLAAFFDGFSHGDCMNFTMKATDVFESFARTGKFCVRIVDAKFALPKGGDERKYGKERGFISLDSPEYPGEHDDITISFDIEADRDKFAQALPSAVKTTSRLGTARR